jgi:hypothetical protein
MSSLRTAAVTDTRLAVITDTTANLIVQLRELERLRERVRKAELARRSRRIGACATISRQHMMMRRPMRFTPLQLRSTDMRVTILSDRIKRDNVVGFARVAAGNGIGHAPMIPPVTPRVKPLDIGAHTDFFGS